MELSSEIGRKRSQTAARSVIVNMNKKMLISVLGFSLSLQGSLTKDLILSLQS